jgi:hypothetical protein
MKREQDRFEMRGAVSQPTECSIDRLQPMEIVGQVDNPVLEAMRRLWWRAFDRLCYYVVFIRLSIHSRIYGPEPPTPGDLHRETDY